MKSLLLIILTLVTACRVSSDESEESEESEELEVKGCRGGWVDFTCKYPDNYTDNKAVYFSEENQQIPMETRENQWKKHSRFSLYHNATHRSLRVIISDLQNEDDGNYECIFGIYRRKVQLELDEFVCQDPMEVYRGAETPTCQNPGVKSAEKFFCRERSPICEDISSNVIFTLSDEGKELDLSINETPLQHQGVYWCGLKSEDESFRAGVGQINYIPTFTASVSVGETFTHRCEYPNGAPIKKFICKGDNPASCQRLISANQGKKNKGRFSIDVAQNKLNINFTVRRVALDDSGSFWCGAVDLNKHRNQMYQRIRLDVVPAATSTSRSTSTSTHSTLTTGVSHQNKGGAPLAVIVPAVCAAALLLLLLLVFVCKWTKRSTNGEALNQKEERAYEEIQEHPQKPASGTALKTIYTTANLPTIPSAPNEYDSITFTNHSADANTNTYSTVQDAVQSPAHSAVSHPSGLDPFYSTLGNPQQQ